MPRSIETFANQISFIIILEGTSLALIVTGARQSLPQRHHPYRPPDVWLHQHTGVSQVHGYEGCRQGVACDGVDTASCAVQLISSGALTLPPPGRFWYNGGNNFSHGPVPTWLPVGSHGVDLSYSNFTGMV